VRLGCVAGEVLVGGWSAEAVGARGGLGLSRRGLDRKLIGGIFGVRVYGLLLKEDDDDVSVTSSSSGYLGLKIRYGYCYTGYRILMLGCGLVFSLN
jgi:hypothetical protein